MSLCDFTREITEMYNVRKGQSDAILSQMSHSRHMVLLLAAVVTEGPSKAVNLQWLWAGLVELNL